MTDTVNYIVRYWSKELGMWQRSRSLFSNLTLAKEYVRREFSGGEWVQILDTDGTVIVDTIKETGARS